MKKFKLLKSIPITLSRTYVTIRFLPAGTLLVKSKPWDSGYQVDAMQLPDVWFSAIDVERNTEYFEEVKEETQS